MDIDPRLKPIFEVIELLYRCKFVIKIRSKNGRLRDPRVDEMIDIISKELKIQSSDPCACPLPE